MVSAYLNKWDQIPLAVKKFFLKGLLMLVAWKVIYLVLLLPGRLLDAPLTTTVGQVTTWGLNTLSRSDNYTSRSELGRELDVDQNATSTLQQSVYSHNKKIVGVYDGCNALELMVLYAGFIICIPAPSKRKWLFIFGGIAAIFVVNILRCIGVAYLVQYHPQRADFAHHYVFVFVVYGLIIALWLWFTNNIKLKPDGQGQG